MKKEIEELIDLRTKLDLGVNLLLDHMTICGPLAPISSKTKNNDYASQPVRTNKNLI